MGENKGHSDKAPSYPELDEMGSAASRAGQSAGNRQSAGQQQDAGLRQDSSIGQQGSQQQAGGNQQSAGGQRQNQQKGGQHASGGTPALDDLDADLDSRHRGSLGNASRQMDQTSGWNGKQDKHR
jgi:Ca-activated chloride channel family protein